MQRRSWVLVPTLLVIVTLVPQQVAATMAGGSAVPEGLPRHDVRAAVDVSPPRLRVIDRMTLWHPGGPAATFRCTLAARYRLQSVRWRSSTLEARLEGAEVVVPLPYASGPGPITLELRYDGDLERVGTALPLGRRGSWIPTIEGGAGTAAVSIKVPPGSDVIGATAPVSRHQATDGSLLCRFPGGSIDRASLMIVGSWAVETVPVDGVRLEVAARDRELARTATEAIERMIRGLSFLAPSDPGRRSYTFLLNGDPDLAAPTTPGFAVVAASDALFAPTTEEISRAAARCLWTSAFAWNDDEPDRILLDGLVSYSTTAVLAGRTTSTLFRQRLEQVETTVRDTRPVPQWRRWRGRTVPSADRGFGLLHMLRGLVGSAVFLKTTREFAAEAARRGRASAGLFAEVLGQQGTVVPAWLFDAYLVEGFLPDLVVQEVVLQEQRRPVELLFDSYGQPSDGGRYVSEIRLVQNGEMQFRGTVGPRIVTDIDVLDTEVAMDGRVAKVQVITARPIRRVIVDPMGKLIESNEKNNTLDVASGIGRS